MVTVDRLRGELIDNIKFMGVASPEQLVSHLCYLPFKRF